MSILFKNLQRAVHLNTGRIQKDIKLLRCLAGVESFDLGVLCVDNRTIQYLNNRFRNHDKPTDILAFPFFENLRPGEIPKPQHEDDRNMGDLFLGIPYIATRCQDEDMDLQNTVAVLITHGLCHLLGHDHETEKEWQLMYNKELMILEQYNKVERTDLKPLTVVGH